MLVDDSVAYTHTYTHMHTAWLNEIYANSIIIAKLVAYMSKMGNMEGVKTHIREMRCLVMCCGTLNGSTYFVSGCMLFTLFIWIWIWIDALDFSTLTFKCICMQIYCFRYTRSKSETILKQWTEMAKTLNVFLTHKLKHLI